MNYDQFVGGWLVGNFSPALFNRNDIEVGVKYLKRGFVDDPHYHKNYTEFNLILYGTIECNGIKFFKGDFMNFSPYQISKTTCLDDACILVIRDGSGVNDKYPV